MIISVVTSNYYTFHYKHRKLHLPAGSELCAESRNFFQDGWLLAHCSTINIFFYCVTYLIHDLLDKLYSLRLCTATGRSVIPPFDQNLSAAVHFMLSSHLSCYWFLTLAFWQNRKVNRPVHWCHRIFMTLVACDKVNGDHESRCTVNVNRYGLRAKRTPVNDVSESPTIFLFRLW